MHHEWIYLFIVAVGLIAGFIDAIVGGGGLLTLPALIAIGVPTRLVLGTNKLAASMAVLSSTWVFWRKNLFRVQAWSWVMVAAIIGAGIGTCAVHLLNTIWLAKLIPILIIIIVIYMALPKSLKNKGRPHDYAPPKFSGCLMGTGLGFYDGFFGPGTGSFWATGLVFFYKMDLVQATAVAKLMNFVSNITAAIVFAVYGTIDYPIAIALMLGYVSGSYFGAHSAIRHGQKLIKPIFLIVVSVIAVKLILQYWL